MARNAITFRQLLGLLKRLGFSGTEVPGSHRLLTHRDSGTEVLLPLRDPGPRGMPNYLALVEATLDQRGLMDREQFAEWKYAHGHNGRSRSANGAAVAK